MLQLAFGNVVTGFGIKVIGGIINEFIGSTQI
jgi:hypothetical protein